MNKSVQFHLTFYTGHVQGINKDDKKVLMVEIWESKSVRLSMPQRRTNRQKGQRGTDRTISSPIFSSLLTEKPVKVIWPRLELILQFPAVLTERP